MPLWVCMVFVAMVHVPADYGFIIKIVPRPNVQRPDCLLIRRPCQRVIVNDLKKPPPVPSSNELGINIFEEKDSEEKDDLDSSEDDGNKNEENTKEKRFYLGIQFAVNWHDAVQRCTANNQKLASITNQKEQDLLIEVIRSHGFQGFEKQRFWIGGNDLARQGHFVWVGGQPMSYTNWDQQQPDNFCNNEHCVEVVGARGYKWNDLDCRTLLYYVCEYY